VNGKEIITEIKNAVIGVKQKNEEVISVDALLNYLDALEKDASEVDENHARRHEAALAEYQAENERNIAHYNAQQLHAVEMFRSVISYGAAALKSAILINGGAAAALLAFIGNIWSKGVTPTGVAPLTSAIAYFSFGVLAAAIGTASSYFAQYYYGESYQRTGVVFHTLTAVLVVGSYVLFGLGISGAYEAFVAQLSPNK